MSEPFEIRLARPQEYDEIGRVTVQGYRHDGFLDGSEDYATSLLDAATRAVDAELWVAVQEGTERVLGTVTFCPLGSPYRELAAPDEGEFRMLAVDPTARGLGVGRSLVRHCLEASRAQGFRSVVICSLPTMTTAHALYLSLGFRRDTSLDWTPAPGVDLWGFRSAPLPENQP